MKFISTLQLNQHMNVVSVYFSPQHVAFMAYRCWEKLQWMNNLKMNKMSWRIWKDYQCSITVCHMFYYFCFTKNLPATPKPKDLLAQWTRNSDSLFTCHTNAHLPHVHGMLVAVLSYFITLFKHTVTILYLEKWRGWEKLFWVQTMVSWLQNAGTPLHPT